MRIGIALREPRPGPDTLGALRTQVEQHAADGFPSVWLAHVFGFDALTALAVAGRGVPGVELGTAVVPTYPRHPAALAQQALTVDAALGGRLALGIGLSHQVVIEGMFGYSFERPARHMDEYLSVLLPLLETGSASFQGETVSAEVALGTPRREGGRLPVLLAAMAPRMLRLAGGRADGTILWMTGPATVQTHVVPTLAAAAEEAGRPAPRVVCELPIGVTDDVGAARERASASFGFYGSLPSYRAMLDREGAAGPADVAILGDEATVREQVAAVEAVGVTDFVAASFLGGEDGERTRALLRELAGGGNA